MIIKRQVLDILVEWQAEWEAERAKWMRRQEL
jgi:hypothetical protein